MRGGASHAHRKARESCAIRSKKASSSPDFPSSSSSSSSCCQIRSCPPSPRPSCFDPLSSLDCLSRPLIIVSQGHITTHTMVNAPESQKIRHVSTGRGGAANFRQATDLARKHASRPVTAAAATDDECALTRVTTKASLGARFATGRGGAGNMLPSGTVPLPPMTEPQARRPRTNIIVGRGGAGNFKDAKSGRSASTSFGSDRANRPSWASRVPRIDAAFDDHAIDDNEEEAGRPESARRNSVFSTKSAPAGNGTTFFGKMRRRLSSFGTVLQD